MVVIAAVDRSDRGAAVVREAASLAGAFGDTVHVVHVLSRGEFVEIEQTEVRESGRAVDIDRIRDYAAGIANDTADGIDVPTESVGLVGDTAEEILHYAAERDARYIVVGPRKRSPTGKAVFGSTSQRILLNADCPVVVTITQETE